MERREDRGTISKIDFTIEYPDGRVKRVTFSEDPADNEYNHHLISEIAGVDFDLDVSESTKSFHLEDEALANEWDAVKAGDDYKPAMVIKKRDGTKALACGGHRNGLSKP